MRQRTDRKKGSANHKVVGIRRPLRGRLNPHPERWSNT
jgi:hypothetical protein